MIKAEIISTILILMIVMIPITIAAIDGRKITAKNEEAYRDRYIGEAYEWFIRNNPTITNIHLEGINDRIHLVIKEDNQHINTTKINLYLDDELIDVSAIVYEDDSVDCNQENVYVYRFEDPYKNVIDEKIVEIYERNKDIFPELKGIDNKEKADKFLKVINEEN